MQPSLPAKMRAYLNRGDAIVAEMCAEAPNTRGFVRIRPRPNADVPREKRRYLNSRFSMWEYWHYDFRRIMLRSGWEDPELHDDYDLFLLQDERRTTRNEHEFYRLLTEWAIDPSAFRHASDSDCPE